MRSFTFLSVLFSFILLVSPESSLNAQTGTVKSSTDLPWSPVIGGQSGKTLFKVALDISKNHITGLMFFKQTSDTTFRVIFSSEVGMNYFDIEFIREKFVVHSCFPSFSKKSFLSVLSLDLQLLLPMTHSGKYSVSPLKGTAGNSGHIVKSAPGKFIYSIDEESGRILSIASKGKFLRKTRIESTSNDKGLPAGITIHNPTLKMTMSMSLLDN